MSSSKQRVTAAWRGEPHDYVPFTTWSFGVQPPQPLRWRRNGQEISRWYTKRLEHLHTLPEPWELEDDFQRVLAWQSLGVDDVLDVSVPWSMDPLVSWTDNRAPQGVMHPDYPVLVREYETPGGKLRHAVKQNLQTEPPGWVIQPPYVSLFEDFNIPRGIKHAVATAEDIRIVPYLYQAPREAQTAWFEQRMDLVRQFAEEHGVAVQAWAGFGMDAVIWMMGVEGALFMAMEHPADFKQLCDTVHETDVARFNLALATEGVDMVVCRGWYGSTDFWSPKLCDKFYFPYVKDLADIAHKHGKPFGLTMSTGLRVLGSRIADAGVDVHYFVDPVGGNIPLDEARRIFADRVTVVGGMSVIHCSEPAEKIRAEVRQALDAFGGNPRFILQPVDSLYPDTEWAGLEVMIDTWKQCR